MPDCLGARCYAGNNIERAWARLAQRQVLGTQVDAPSGSIARDDTLVSIDCRN